MYIYIYIKFISILKLRSAKFIIIIAKREITDGLARVNATGSRNLSLFSKVGPSSFRNLKKKKKTRGNGSSSNRFSIFVPDENGVEIRGNIHRGKLGQRLNRI